jgi:hypothetical protein
MSVQTITEMFVGVEPLIFEPWSMNPFLGAWLREPVTFTEPWRTGNSLSWIQCGIDGCPEIFWTDQRLSSEPHFVCRYHTRTEQKVFFQEHQFDGALRSSSKPTGTSHITNQGSDLTPSDIYTQLRQRVDGSDQFMTSHGIITRRGFKRPCPSWMLDDSQVRAFLLRQFPQILKSGKQRDQAGLWSYLIYECFRRALDATTAANDYNQVAGGRTVTAVYVRRVIQRIKKARAAQLSEKAGVNVD